MPVLAHEHHLAPCVGSELCMAYVYRYSVEASETDGLTHDNDDMSV